VRGGVEAYVAWVATIEAALSNASVSPSDPPTHASSSRVLLLRIALAARGGGAVLGRRRGRVAFSALSPTGYLSTLLAGALFPWWLAWPLAYTRMVCACESLVITVTSNHR
jgi:hypothetical protein